MRRVSPVVVLALLGLWLASHAWAERRNPPSRMVPFAVRLHIVDERGVAIPRATVKLRDRVVTALDGVTSLETDQPIAVVVSAAGYLPEPVVLSRSLAPSFTVRLWAKVGRDGVSRVVLHFGGDTMLGRRFVRPVRTDTPVLPAGGDGRAARAVVSDLAPLFSAADVSTVNLETVVGTLARPHAYDAKRFLLETPPSALAALDELGVDAVTLGNNHANDWEDAGVTATRKALGTAGLPFTGAGRSDAEARVPVLLERRGEKIGVLSYTTVTGDFVNDNLPTSADPIPARIPAAERWQYAVRRFATRQPGATLPPGSYRAGDVWEWFDQLEGLDPATEAAVWRELRATYPELQDWAARRGHAGAAAFSRTSVEHDVRALREAGADVVVVEIHGGFQFSEATSAFFRSAAHASIDAGADVVVGHHPHVIQGFEWYRGRLVIHSLGNLVFDQDFLSTFPSMFVRAVYAGGTLLEARAIPLFLDRYRPVPIAGELAEKVLRGVRSASVLGAPAARTSGAQIARVPAPTTIEPGVEPADLRLDGNSAVIVRPLPERRLTLSVDGDGVATVPASVIIQPQALPRATHVGLDLLRVGDADDTTANGHEDGGVGWDFAAAKRAHLVAIDRLDGDLGFRLDALEQRRASLRPVARIMRKSHRFRTAAGERADGFASYTVRFRVRNTGKTDMFLRLDLYRFDDTNPLRDPESRFLRRVMLPVSLPRDDAWHTVSVRVPRNVFRPVAGQVVNSAMVYVGLPSGRWREVELDRLQVLEWRRAETFPRGLWLEADALAPAQGAGAVVAVVR
ncbi:MAG: CapA family protein [Gaiellales bacterium]